MTIEQMVYAVADRLATPTLVDRATADRPWWPQSLAHGAPGIAVLHIELAAAGARPWRRVHDWMRAATSAPVTRGRCSHPFYGAPAIAHALACAAAARPECYRSARAVMEAAVVADARRRVAAARARIDAGQLPALSEFDAIQGLTGYGALLLRRRPDDPTLREVLEYLVRLTEPLHVAGETLPGWWSGTGPTGHPDARFPGGHANSGVSHGIGGPLALLALAARAGVVLDGHLEAIERICRWFDRWRSDTAARPVWPYWITRHQLRAGTRDLDPRRPSWCYGTAGLARAHQLAALATGDHQRRRTAEGALASTLVDPAQLAATSDHSLCHGFAGIAHVAARAAVDAEPATASALHAVIPDLLARVQPAGADPASTAANLVDPAGCGPGFLEGAAGIALAAFAAVTGPPATSWDTCLLIA